MSEKNRYFYDFFKQNQELSFPELEALISNPKNKEEKKFFLFAGVNGAGKSTLYRLILNYHNPSDLGERINTDEIVNEIGDWRNDKDQIRAGRIALKKRKEYIEQGVRFNQETTLTGNSIVKTIKEIKNNGYKIIMMYIGVENPEIAKERIKIWVANGGHHIPDNIVEKRYHESLQNLEKVANFCDNLIVFDNSIFGKVHTICFEKKNNSIKLSIEKNLLPEWVKKLREKLER